MGLASKIKSSELAAPTSSAPSAPALRAQQQQYGQNPDFYGAAAYPSPSAPPAQPLPAHPHDHSYPQQAYAYPASHPTGRAESPPAPAQPLPAHPHDHSYPHEQAYAYPAPHPTAHVESLPPTAYPYARQQPHGAEFHDYSQFSSAPPAQPQYANYMNSAHMDGLAKKLQYIIQSNGLQRFYDSAKFHAVLQKVALIDFGQIAAQWKIGKELAYDLAPLALYDIVFYCDDSGSMAFEEDGDRINDLKYILAKVSGIATLFDDDGIIVRFMNCNVNGDGVRNAADVEQLMLQVRFSGATPLGTNLDRKVIQPLVLGQAMSNTSSMAKPVLAIVITDGEPYGESRDTIVQVIRHAKDALARTPYGSGALAIQIAQVGKDAKTQKFLESLDKDPVVGGMIDCTSYYEMEEEEFARKGVTLTPELWLLKMCVGAIDPDYDSKDD